MNKRSAFICVHSRLKAAVVKPAIDRRIAAITADDPAFFVTGFDASNPEHDSNVGTTEQNSE